MYKNLNKTIGLKENEAQVNAIKDKWRYLKVDLRLIQKK